MFQTDLGKFIFICCFWLTMFLTTCQADTITIQENRPPVSVNVTETPMASIFESTPTIESIPTPSPTFIAILTSTPSLQESTATPTSEPTIMPTRTSFYGWLVFSSRRQDTNEDGVVDEKDGTHLYKLEVSTGTMTQLTFGNHRDLYPAWSPDRSQIAFVSNRDGNFELYLMNIDGTEVRQLTHSPENEITPKWSPDGTNIVYVLSTTLDSGLQEKQLYLISTSGENMHQITNSLGNDYAPDWSPDGRYLVFTRDEEHFDSEGNRDSNIYLWDMEENQFFNLTASNREPSQIRFTEPQWLPKNDYFLSLTQIPGDLSSAGIKVFELEWIDGQPTLYRVFAIADAYGPYVWGPNGEWLISIGSNDQYYGTVSNESLNDLILLPVDFSTQRRATTADLTARSSFNYSLVDGEPITNDTYFDNYPDWAP